MIHIVSCSRGTDKVGDIVTAYLSDANGDYHEIIYRIIDIATEEEFEQFCLEFGCKKELIKEAILRSKAFYKILTD